MGRWTKWGGSFDDYSGTVAAGAAAQQVVAADTARSYFLFQNLSSADLYLRFTGTASAGAGSLKIPAGGSYVLDGGFVSSQAASVYGATTGQAYTCWVG